MDGQEDAEDIRDTEAALEEAKTFGTRPFGDLLLEYP